MAKLSAPFEPLIILFARFSSKLACPFYWVEELHTAPISSIDTPLKLSILPPLHVLHGSPNTYDHLRVFGCHCYPNHSTVVANKLLPHSTLCMFLSYSPKHKVYRCLYMTSKHVIISCHVTFDEDSFPFAPPTDTLTDVSNLDFLFDMESSLLPIGLRTPVGSLPPPAATGPLPIDGAGGPSLAEDCHPNFASPCSTLRRVVASGATLASSMP